MGERDRVTHDDLKQTFAPDAERLLGMDDATLERKRKAVRKKTPPISDAEKQGVFDSLKAWFRLMRLLVTGDQPLESLSAGQMWSMAIVALMVVLLVVAVFIAFDRAGPSTSGSPSQTASQRTSPAPAGGGASTTAPNGKRWLIVAGRSGAAPTPQFTIELQGDGPTGPAVWLEPPGAKGTFTSEGDNLDLALVLKQMAAPGVYFDQHYNLKMVRQSDGSLTGTLYREKFRYSGKTGLQREGFDEWQATGEPR